jgi:hypothetical protein
LQAVEEKHKKDGVTLLAVNIDEARDRAKIPAFLKKYSLHCRVLLSDPEHLRGYDRNVASALYVVDRGGLLAGLPLEFLPDFGKRVEARLSDLLAGKPSPGRVIYEVEKAPPGFGVLWMVPLETTVSALALTPPSNGHPAEIGLMDASHLIRYSSRGKLLGDAPLEAENYYVLKGADLDGDGTNEWIAGGDEGFSVVDSSGESYWSYSPSSTWPKIAGILDLDGDGAQEIVVQDGSTVAKKALPGNLWKTPPMGPLRSVVVASSGTLLVQTNEGIQPLERQGRPTGALTPNQGDGVLMGKLDRRGGVAYLFGPPGTTAEVRFPLAGDGKREILVASSTTLKLFSDEGASLLIMRFPNLLSGIPMALGDLDGRPGDEMVLAIPQYGMIALGVSPEAKPFTVGSPPGKGSATPVK